MNIQDFPTPAILVDLDILDANITRYQKACDDHGKQMWPMTKTHKSTEIANMQLAAGATGLLGGTIDECEAFCELAPDLHIMYAYPVASLPNIQRIIEVAKKCNFIARIDGVENARILAEQAEKQGVTLSYTLIVDSGLHRFGILPEDVVAVADAIAGYKNLEFKGISTHPGHVYSAKGHDDLAAYVEDEKKSMADAKKNLEDAGYTVELVTSGSTPTFAGAIDDENINVFHPGNYTFHDVIQMSTETSQEDQCSLTVYATVVSHPQENIFLIDAGAKTFGLDQGAHGNDAIVGFGKVKGHPEVTLVSLSEEVGKLQVEGETSLKVGDKIQVIPNHACVPTNLTSYVYGLRGDDIQRAIAIDVRGNSLNFLEK